jgi:hypothetical protein
MSHVFKYTFFSFTDIRSSRHVTNFYYNLLDNGKKQNIKKL